MVAEVQDYILKIGGVWGAEQWKSKKCDHHGRSYKKTDKADKIESCSA